MKHLNLFKGETYELEPKSVLYYNGTETLTINTGASESGGLVTELAAPKVFNGAPTGAYMDNFCIIGALLSKDGDTWTVWNTNPDEAGYWNPKSDTITTPSTQYGEVVAVCVGRGLWAKIGWSGLTTTYTWAESDSDAIYNNFHAINIHGNGWEATKHMFDVHSGILTGTIWEQLKNGKTDDYDLYLPSKYELLDIHNNTCNGTHVEEQENGSSEHTFNKNLGKLLSLAGRKYWSSSLVAEYSRYYYGSAFGVDFSSGSVGYYSKYNAWYFQSHSYILINNKLFASSI